MIRRVVVALLCMAVLLSQLNLPAAADSLAPLVISEVMTGGLNELGAEDGLIEFIELHNQTPDELDVTGWKIQYFSAARTDVTDPASTPTNNREVILEGKIDGYGYVLLAYHGKANDADVYFGEGDTSTSGWLAKTGGHLRIINSNTPEVIDRVGWGTSSTKQPETKVISAPSVGSSIQRLTAPDNSDLLIDSDDNSADFAELPEPTPAGGALYQDETLPAENEEEIPPESEGPIYYGIIITELLPDPASPKLDSEDEFVELYNPQVFEVNIGGYVLYTGSTTSTYKYVLPDITLLPGEYLALYSSETNLTLVNTTGYVWITDPDGALLHETHWYSNIGTKKSWAWINDGWQITNVLTPSAANAAMVIDDQAPKEEQDSALAPCPAGEYRNPATNRCKDVETEAALLACKPGQERNSTTNRCRTTSVAKGVLAPCKAGQERNPETNRCRNVAGVSTTQKACQEGYERNPETNRCRKKQATLAKTTAGASANKLELTTKVNYAVLSFVSVAALGYGGYEYRHDVLNAFTRFRSRFKKSS